MGFKRKRSSKGGRRRKFKRFRRRSGRSTRRIAYRGYKLAKRINRAIETKYYEVYGTATLVNSGTVYVSLSGMNQGTAQGQRIGNQITITSLRLRFTSTGVDSTNLTRIGLILDRTNEDAALPTDADVWESSSASLPLLYPNWFGRKRFKIIKSWTYTQQTPTAGTIDSYYKYKTYFRKMRLPVSYTGTLSAVANIKTNNLCLFLQGDSTSIPHGTAIYQIRMTYVDL